MNSYVTTLTRPFDPATGYVSVAQRRSTRSSGFVSHVALDRAARGYACSDLAPGARA